MSTISALIQGVELDATGWKIGLEVLGRGAYQRVEEVPYRFRDRIAGESKFGWRAVSEYLRHLGRLQRDRYREGHWRRR